MRTTSIVSALALSTMLGAGATASAARATTARSAAHAEVAAHNATTVSVGPGVYGNYTPLVGDFNGDGHDDVFWYAPGHDASSLWFGHANRQFTSVTETVMGDYTPVVGDLNGDGRADIIWSSSDALPYPVWEGNADGTFSHHSLFAPGTHFTPIVGDFNGDGRDDIFWDSADRGRDYISLGDGTGHFTLHHTTQFEGEHVTAVGDFNGDGRDDIFFESTDPSQANFFALAKSDGTFSTHAEDTQATDGVPLAIDVNGDGRTDILVYQPGSASDWVWYSGASGLPQRRLFTSINGSYRPVVGDFDGDGHSDIFWYAPGSAPDHIWFDVAHDLPAPSGSEPHQQWEVPIGSAQLASATVDATQAYAAFSSGLLQAYSRANGLPVWSHNLGCPASVRRDLDVLLVSCGAAVSVYNVATGALSAHYTRSGSSCASDSPYYFTEWVVPPGGHSSHLTVAAMRNGAVVWYTPVTVHAPCALSGDRLMMPQSPTTLDGLTEDDVATHRQAFTTSTVAVWSFGPAGYVAGCDGSDHLIGIGPTGQVAWKTDLLCPPGEDAPFSFERSTVDLDSGADLDIVSGEFLGAYSPFPPIGACCIGRMFGGPITYATAHAPQRGQCPGPGSETMFLGPYGASPWLTAATPLTGFDFSLRAIAVQRAAPTCSPPTISAWDERGVIRWTMPAEVRLDLSQPMGNDMATNGGVESSALIGINVSDGTLELIDLP